VFQNSEMMARGEPSPEELAVLEPFRDRVLPEVFGPAWVPPDTDGSGQDRKLLRSAGELLNAAGWTVKDGRRSNAKGEQLTVEFLLTERSFEPHHQTFIKNLKVLGIDANIRLVDPAQAEERQKDFDFDIAIARFIFPKLFLERISQDQGLQQSRRHIGPGGRCARRQGGRRADAISPRQHLPRARSRAAFRPLLDPALEQGLALDRLLGPVRFPGDQAPLRAGSARNLVARSGTRRQAGPGEIA
jgi:hypothetical protein